MMKRNLILFLSTILVSVPVFGQDDLGLGDLDGFLDKVSLQVNVGINQSFGLGSTATTTRNTIQNFNEQDFQEESSFPYTAKGTVTGQGAMRPVTGFQAGIYAAYDLTENLALGFGLQLVQGGWKWFMQEDYADDEFQYDEQLYYRSKTSFGGFEIPFFGRLSIGKIGFLGGAGFGQTFSASERTVDENTVWVNGSKNKTLSRRETETIELTTGQSYVTVHAGVDFPLSQKLSAALKAQANSSLIGAGASAGLIMLDIRYDLLGQ